MVNGKGEAAAAVKYNPQITLVNMLQVLFIGLKLTEEIDWNWFLVLLPVIIEAGLIALFFSLGGIALYIGKRRREQERKALWQKLQNDSK